MSHVGVLRRVAGLALALALAGGLAGVQPAGAAVVLSCGAVVTTDVVLAADIGPCHDHAIVVGADNITVDLGGHRVFGEGGTNVVHQASGVFSDNHSGVVVRNGTVHSFYHGVRIRRGHHNRVTGMLIRNNAGGDGIVFETSTDNVANFNTLVRNSGFAAIATFNTAALPPAAARNRIEDNSLSQNTSHGISVENGPDHVVRRNRVDASSRDGITLFSGVSNVVIENNQVTRSGNNGINVRNGAHHNVVRGNQVRSNVQRGILVAGQSNTIAGNTSFANGQLDLQDTNAGNSCDANLWSGNRFGTASPACTQA